MHRISDASRAHLAGTAKVSPGHTIKAMATKKPKGLGMGLEALLGPKVEDRPPPDGEPTRLAIDRLEPGRYQPRTRMDEGSLYELAESIRSQGVMQPVLVRPVAGDNGGGGGAGTRYEIIAGERRVRAARLAGLDEVPVLVRVVADEAAAVMALIENIQREDLNPLEEAQGLKRLVDEFALTHEQAAQAVGRSRSAATNLLRLLQLTDPVQQMLMAGDLDMGHARALLALPGAQQITSATEIATRKLNVREAERLVARVAAGGGRQAPLLRTRTDKPRELQRLETALADRLTATVEIRVKKRTRRGEQGEIAIAFDSLDELNGLLARLGVDDA
jgi:ParB family chromosome partitioning protein